MTTQADQVYAALNATETSETLLGTINVPTSGVSKIVGVYGDLMQVLATSGETVSGYFRLSFGSVPGKFKFPARPLAGAAAAGVIQQPVQIIPVNIPVQGNETIQCYMTANKAMTGTSEGTIGVLME